eukprot:31335-Pelagococcus_subviridis.AAC.3
MVALVQHERERGREQRPGREHQRVRLDDVPNLRVDDQEQTGEGDDPHGEAPEHGVPPLVTRDGVVVVRPPRRGDVVRLRVLQQLQLRPAGEVILRRLVLGVHRVVPVRGKLDVKHAEPRDGVHRDLVRRPLRERRDRAVRGDRARRRVLVAVVLDRFDAGLVQRGRLVHAELHRGLRRRRLRQVERVRLVGFGHVVRRLPFPRRVRAARGGENGAGEEERARERAASRKHRWSELPREEERGAREDVSGAETGSRGEND